MDLVQSEYGWPDEVVMETPVCRIRQMVENISARRLAETRARLTELEWATRTMCQFVAATSGSEKLAQQAAEVKIKMSGEQAEASRDETPPEVFVEEGSQVAADKNRPGTFEALTRGMA